MTEKKKFLSIVLGILILFNVSRFIGWKYFSQTTFWQRIIYDNLHHYQLGVLLLIAGLILKNLKKLRVIIFAFASGLIIDESMYLFYPINKSFSHISPIGILFEFMVFLFLTIIIFYYKSKRRQVND